MPNDFRAFARKRRPEALHHGLRPRYRRAHHLRPDENSELTISQAVQASTALPIFYKPARINGVDYVDGGVRHTANIDVAIEKGADLIICYNPFRPFLNRVDAEDGDASYFAEGRYLSDRGLKVVINQVFRTLLHSRLKLGIQRYLRTIASRATSCCSSRASATPTSSPPTRWPSGSGPRPCSTASSPCA